MTEEGRPLFRDFGEQVRTWAKVANRIEIDHRWDGGAHLAQEGDQWVLRIGPVEHEQYLGEST